MKKIVFLPLFLILVSCGGSTPRVNPEPVDVLPTSITVNPLSLELDVNQTYNLSNLLSVEVLPENTTNKNVTYTSNSSDLFSVNNNIIKTYNKGGTSTLTVASVADNNIKKDVSITVKALTPVKTTSKYQIKYDLGSRSTAYQFKADEAELIRSTFVVNNNDEDIISSVSSFSTLYGGGYGGSGENKWVKNDVIKFGTTSVNGEIILSLSKPVSKVSITGMVGAKTLKVQIGDSNSFSDETKTVIHTCNDLPVASKDIADNDKFETFTEEFEPTSSLKIATLNNKVLYISSIELTYSSEIIPTEKYTITWKNYNGETLEVDNDVPQGTVPTYKGATPSKPSDEEYDYIFNGWTPKVVATTADATYTATYFAKAKGSSTPGVDPVLSLDGTYVEYGFYPQSYVSDSSIINELENLTSEGWVEFQDAYYVKATANTCNGEAYTFNDNVAITNDTEYWFKCEPIKWDILSNSNNEYTLIASDLLDRHCYYNGFDVRENDVYPNNYKESDIRAYLNNEFLTTAFKYSVDHLLHSDVNNDKIYLPSKDEADSLSDKTAKTTDYNRAIGAWSNKENAYKYNGAYWTRTPSTNFNYAVWNVNSAGVLSEYSCDGSDHSIRPCIKISF